MSEEPKQKDENAQGNEEKGSIWSKAARVFSDNPTIVVTVLYAYVTVVGIIYSAALYGRFGINVFDYSEIADFVLAAFKNPVAFFAAVLLAGMGSAVLSYTASVRRRQRRKTEQELQDYFEDLQRQLGESGLQDYFEDLQLRLGESNDALILKPLARRDDSRDDSDAEFIREIGKIERDVVRAVRENEEELLKQDRREAAFISITFAVLIVISTVLLPYYSAAKRVSSIKHGEHPAIDVRYRSFSGSAGQVTDSDLELIGATQKAAFFYDVEEKRTIVLPQAQIVSIEVPDRR